MGFEFLADTYETERLKTLSVWSQFRDDDLALRPEPRARTPREHMVHQCVSEDLWMTRMLGLDVGLPQLPVPETRLGFLTHYAEASGRRLARLRSAPLAGSRRRRAFSTCGAPARGCWYAGSPTRRIIAASSRCTCGCSTSRSIRRTGRRPIPAA